jgi:hypothetical protein
MFAEGHLPEPLRGGDERRDEVKHTIHMDFGNYTLGRLFHDRRNYDNAHEGHQNATDQILGVIHDLGWRKSEFLSIDQTLGRQDQDGNAGRVERYGKKYSWIGLYLVSGLLNARGERVYWLEVDVDPTFPQISPPLPLTVPTWVRPTPVDDRNWLINGVVTVPDDLLYSDYLAGAEGPWVLVHAEIDARDERTGRGAYGLFNTVALAPGDLEALLSWWSNEDHPGRDLIDLPTAYYLFAGEIPWHPRMVSSGDDIAGTGMRPISQAEDGWVDPHDSEDPYIDHMRVDLPATQETDAATDALGELVEAPYGEARGAEMEGFNYLAFVESEAAYPATIPAYAKLEYESLAHTFGWEGHNSSENEAFGYVPSQRLSQHAGLRSVPAGFDQVDAEGRPAAMSFAAPEGFDGHLLYVREDIVKAYAGDRSVVTFGWGERQIHAAWNNQIPEQLLAVYRTYRNIWRTHRLIADGQGEAPGVAQRGRKSE